MRIDDLTPPAVTPHELPPDAPMAAWPGRLVIALERLPQAAYVWDDADDDVVWDQVPAGLDAPNGGMVATAYAPPAGVTQLRIVTDPPSAELYWYPSGGSVYIGRRDVTGPNAPDPIRSHEAWEIRGVGDPETLGWRWDVHDVPDGAAGYYDPRGRWWVLVPGAGAVVGVDLVWDAPFVGSGFTDASCDFQALTIDSGEPDELGLYPASSLELSLANPTGEYTSRTVDGRLVYYAPGRQVCVWWLDPADEPWWLFSGRVADWREAADGTVSVEAFDGFAQLAQEPGADWTPGTPGQFPGPRIAAVLAGFGYTDPVRLDTGDLSLSAPVTSRSPLEEIQTVALSDGGVFAGDADGALVYRDRGWRAGRSDQTRVPAFSDNICTVDAVVWDPELANADDGLATSVVLTNADGVTVSATLPGDDPDAWWYRSAIYRLTHPEPDLWDDPADGQHLAEHILAVRSSPTLSIAGFVLHVHDPQQDLWALAADRRLGDRIRYVREQLGPDGEIGELDVELVLASLRHEITPDGWQTAMSTTRAVAYVRPELWDVTRFVWDQNDPRNVWRY